MSDPCCPPVAAHYPVEVLPRGWMTAEVKYLRRDGQGEKTRVEIIDLKSNKRYLHEPLRMIANKCFMIALSVPLYTAAYMAWNSVRIPTNTLFTLLEGTENLFHVRTCSEAMSGIVDTVGAGVRTAALGVWTVVRAPFYALQMFFGALIGICFPLDGRVILEAETDLHQKTVRHDCMRHPVPGDHPDWSAMCDALKRHDTPHTLFLAHCMQPRGRTTDRRVISVRPLDPPVA